MCTINNTFYTYIILQKKSWEGSDPLRSSQNLPLLKKERETEEGNSQIKSSLMDKQIWKHGRISFLKIKKKTHQNHAHSHNKGWISLECFIQKLSFHGISICMICHQHAHISRRFTLSWLDQKSCDPSWHCLWLHREQLNQKKGKKGIDARVRTKLI